MKALPVGFCCSSATPTMLKFMLQPYSSSILGSFQDITIPFSTFGIPRRASFANELAGCCGLSSSPLVCRELNHSCCCGVIFDLSTLSVTMMLTSIQLRKKAFLRSSLAWPCIPESTIPGVTQRNLTWSSSVGRQLHKQFMAAFEHAYGTQDGNGRNDTPEDVIKT